MGVLKLVLLVTCVASVTPFGIDNYWKKNKLIDLEELSIVGANVKLSEKEKHVNKILMSYKTKEYDDGIVDPAKFPPSKHFFQAKDDIEKSKVFQFIKHFPKGASLHTHDAALASGEFVYMLTYTDNLYACMVDGNLALKFFKTPDNECDWFLLKDMREADPTFDYYLKAQLSVVVDDPYNVYPTTKSIWRRFGATFGRIQDFITYRPIWKAFFYQVFKEYYDDNIMYIEFRSDLPNLYDLDGTIYGPIECAGVMRDALHDFVKDHPDFLGARLIYSGLRGADNATIERYVQITLQLKKKYSDFFAGFDLVGPEDEGRPLQDFYAQLEELKKNNIKFFFHAGQTNWYGTEIDQNLFDAVLFGTIRIGGGQALIKHPELLKLIKLKDIAVEIIPISTQVFKLTGDMRNHPLIYLIAQDYPIVICNDDPGVWGSKALSYDWYEAFMGMTSRSTDLKFLKKIALNSIEYSAMPLKEKLIAVKEWYKRWDAFIDKILENNTHAIN